MWVGIIIIISYSDSKNYAYKFIHLYIFLKITTNTTSNKILLVSDIIGEVIETINYHCKQKKIIIIIINKK